MIRGQKELGQINKYMNMHGLRQINKKRLDSETVQIRYVNS